MSYNPYSNSPNPPQQNPYSDHQAAGKLKAPGIALIVVGALGLLLMGAYAVLTLIAFSSGAPGFEPPPEMTDEAEKTGFYIGAYGAVAVIILNTILQILVILGGVAMIRAKGRGMAYTGCILSVIPCLSSSLCLFGIPFGVWGLVVLSDPNVKRLFK